MSADPSKPGEFHPVFLISWPMAGGYLGPKEVRAQMERDLPALLATMNDAAAEFAAGIPGESKVLVFVEDIAEDGGGSVEGYPARLRLCAGVDATGRGPELLERAHARLRAMSPDDDEVGGDPDPRLAPFL
jgi:hypothetical protein